MIKYLPIPYKNELFFSILSRCYSNSPYTSSIKFTSTIFNRANEYIDYLFYNCLNEDTKKLIDNLLGLEDIIVNHTMIGYYSMFLDMDKYSIVKSYSL